MVQEEIGIDEGDGGGIGLSAGALIATAIGAGVIAYLIRRARAAETERAKPPTPAEWLRSPELRERTASATREFVLDRVIPEMKPVLLDLLRDAKGYVDEGFKRVERAIKNL